MIKVNRQDIVELMKDVYTSSEAAEYLNISTQRLNQLVHDKRIEPIKVSKSIMLLSLIHILIPEILFSTLPILGIITVRLNLLMTILLR